MWGISVWHQTFPVSETHDQSCIPFLGYPHRVISMTLLKPYPYWFSKIFRKFQQSRSSNKCIRQPNDGCSWHYEIFVREDCEAGSGFRPRDLSFAPFLFLHGPLNFIFHFNTSKWKKGVLNLKTRCCIYKYLWLCRKPNLTFLCLPLVCVRSMF